MNYFVIILSLLPIIGIGFRGPRARVMENCFLFTKVLAPIFSLPFVNNPTLTIKLLKEDAMLSLNISRIPLLKSLDPRTLEPL